MSKINFRASSSPGHVIHKVNFKVKGQYVLLFSNREITDFGNYFSNTWIPEITMGSNLDGHTHFGVK